MLPQLDSLLDKGTAGLLNAALRQAGKKVLAAYLLAPLTNGYLDFDDDAPTAGEKKMQEMLDRGLKDASFLSSIVLNEIATHSNVHSTLVHILSRAMDERDEAQRESARYREALASAEADRHPCTALHTRIAELQRHIGEQHGFTLTSCARCNRDLIATTEGNDELNNAMDICSPCTDEMNREHQTAAIKDAEKVLLDMENLADHDGVIGDDFYQAAAALRTALQPVIKERVEVL